jgi:two-component system C4-dicarboxylate transport response regulator DctD
MPEAWDVLVIDDEPVVRDSIRLVLTAAGLTVATAADARSGLAHPAAAGCRLVLCDLMLPDGDGIEVIRALHAIRPDLPVVAITGYATLDNARRAMDEGATDFLPKPFEEPELLEVVRRALSHGAAVPQERNS